MREAELLEALDGVVRRCKELEFQLGEGKIDVQRKNKRIAELEAALLAEYHEKDREDVQTDEELINSRSTPDSNFSIP